MTTTIETFRNIRRNLYRDRMEAVLMWKQLMEENPTDNPEAMTKRKEGLDKYIREARKARDMMADDSLTYSIRDRMTKRFVRPYGDSEPDVTEYWYEVDNGETDEEINEYCAECIEIPYLMREYSPTGQMFTKYVDWKRTPYGIRIIHAIGMDI